MQYVTTGDLITSEPGFLKGHGTISQSDLKSGDDKKEEKLIATVSGFVERVNKLISVRALNSRYQPEVGDVVVGRILEVADKRWRVDVNSRIHAVLMLSAVDLPGGVQRRRTHQDALEMRTFYCENDLISAEVQKVMSDGTVSLHTRNLKYGKLRNGQFLRVAANLVKRAKHHFHDLPCGVHLIIGTNGYIWLSETANESEQAEEEQTQLNQKSSSTNLKVTKSAELKEIQKEKTSLPSATTPTTSSSPQSSPNSQSPFTQDQKSEKILITADARTRIARVRNSILALSQMNIAIYRDTIMDVYNDSEYLGMPVRDMLHPEAVVRATQTAISRNK